MKLVYCVKLKGVVNGSSDASVIRSNIFCVSPVSQVPAVASELIDAAIGLHIA